MSDLSSEKITPPIELELESSRPQGILRLGDSPGIYIVAVLLSFVIHSGLVVSIVSIPRGGAGGYSNEVVTMVTIAAPLKKPASSQQIVTDIPVPEAPQEDAQFLAAKNVKVEQQQVNRHSPQAAEPRLAKPGAVRPLPGAELEKKKLVEKALPVKKSPSEVSSKSIASTQTPKKMSALAKLRMNQGDIAKQIEKNMRAALALQDEQFGQQGSAAATAFDSLPSNLPDGNLTLLNTKASKFAVFVRRVGMRVFNRIRQVSWKQLSHAEIQGVNQPTKVLVVLTSGGRLREVRLLESSGNGRFDDIVLAAARKSYDPNPPEQARREDGTFHFEFHGRMWSKVYDGQGTRREQRRLLLQAGLL